MAQPKIKEAPERWIASPAGRQVIYIVVAAALGIAAAVGFITADQAADILASIVNLAGVLGFSLAAANKPGKTIDEAEVEYVDPGLGG